MTRKIEQLEDKDDQEIDIITFDFSDGLQSGESISTVVGTTSEVRVGDDADPSVMIVGSPNHTTTDVYQSIGGGVVGNTYVIRCEVTTNIGRTLVLAASLRIVHL